jgi:hypothetical protein
VTLSFATASTASASADRAAASGASFALTATSGADVLVVSKARLVLSRLELQRVGATCASADSLDDHGGDRNDDRNQSRDDDGCAELEVGPSLVDLPVTGSVATTLNVTVPTGQYSAFEAKIQPVESRSNGNDKGGTAFLAAHPELAGVSVLVEGTFNGKAFTYTGAPRAQLESQFDPALSVTDGAANITVHVDLASWFKTSAGTLIDPSTANVNGAASAVVAANIRRSFHAFRDDDRNGHDDRDDHGGDHGNSGRR